MGKFSRREGTDNIMKTKARNGLMSVVIFDHQEVCNKAKSFISSIANASVSLANWSTNEENAAIQDTCSKMYELSMLLSTVIRMFSEEYSLMGNSLRELLRQEMDLGALKKRVNQAELKAAKLKKQNMENVKILENLGNAELDYEELKASFEAQNTKHEILKAQCLRESITRLADGTATFATRVSTISGAEKEIANSIPVVPTQIRREKEYTGRDATDEVVKRTADALNISRPKPIKELLAEKHARARKLKVKSCFITETNSGPNSPTDCDYTIVEQSMSGSHTDLNGMVETEWHDQNRRLSSEQLSCLKDKLAIDSPNGRSYICNPGIQQRLAFRARGLSAGGSQNDPPTSPPPRSPPNKVPPSMDFPKVEPYAVRRWTPNDVGLYARADLYPSGLTRGLSRSWQGNENISEREQECSSDSGEYTKPIDFSNRRDVVYAVLEQEEADFTADRAYLDVLHNES